MSDRHPCRRDCPELAGRRTLRGPNHGQHAVSSAGLLVRAMLIVALGCSGGVDEPSTDRAQLEPVAGLYALVDANGALMDGGRSRLVLTLQQRETRPSYSWSVFPFADASAPRPGGDIGTWARAGSRVEFHSSSEVRTYSASLVGVADNAANIVPGPTLELQALRAGGGTYSFRRIRNAADPGAYLSVAVVDSGGALVAGGTATITAPDGIVDNPGLSGYLPYTTQGPRGSWVVAVTPAAGYALAPGQPNPTRVSVAGGPEPTVLRVRVVHAAGR